MSYLDDLSQELRAVGIRGRRHARIRDEFADHLDCNAQAELGNPRELAHQFADELGTAMARNAALIAFAALVLVGTTVIARLVSYLPLRNTNFSGEDTAALAICFVTAQIAFVTGGLGLARAVRLRNHHTIPAVEARILRRRSAVGLLAGVIASVALPFHASTEHNSTPGDWMGYVAIALTVIVSTLAARPVIAAGRIKPTANGSASDLFDDLGPLSGLATALAGRSVTRFAGILAAALVLTIAAAGFAANDGFDGLFRGLAEGAMFLACYATLGRYLGLRTTASA
jgi:hypothetical protein